MLIIHYRGGIEGSLEAGMVTHSSILAWKIPWTERLLGSLQSIGSQSQTQLTAWHTHTHTHTRFKQTERQVPFIPSDDGGLEEKGGK